MSMRTRAEEYLAMRRSLGFKLMTEGRMLLDFVDRLDDTGQTTITVTAAMSWACASTSTRQRGRRLSVVRGFACHLSTFDPTCEVPPADLLLARAHRPTPYLYSSEEIAALIHAAGTIAAPLHAATVQTVISLIAASGLRLGEALALDRGDVDLDAAVLTVTGKNDQTRLVPVHPTTVAMLDAYAARRDQLRLTRSARASSSPPPADGCSSEACNRPSRSCWSSPISLHRPDGGVPESMT